MAIEQETVQIQAKKVSRCWRVESFFDDASVDGIESWHFRFHFEDLIVTDDGNVLSRSRPEAIQKPFKELMKSHPQLIHQLNQLLDQLNAERLNPPTESSTNG
jgi:hypothetical protein